MIRLGEVALWVAVFLAALSCMLSFAGGTRRSMRAVSNGALALYATGGSTLLAAIGLWAAFFQRDYSIRVVAANSSAYLSTLYTFAAFWAGHSGSLLFWTLLLTLYASVAVASSRRTNRALMPFVTGTLSLVSLGFLLIVAFSANPFERLDWVPPDGLGLNPQFQHPGMLLQVPTMYLGLVGTTVPFAYVMSALLARQFDGEWLAAVRRWASVSWLLLTIGIVLGMWWAYLTPDWGGLWAWDVAENASVLPWLTCTAFLHSLIAQERRGVLRAWNVSLVVATFLLVILGRYLTYSGASASARANTLAPFAGWLLVVFIASSLLAISLVYSRRLAVWSTATPERPFEGEAVLLAMSVGLVAVGVVTLWGTVFPMASEALRGERVIFGPPFFNAVNGALGVGLMALIGIGPIHTSAPATTSLRRSQYLWPALAGLMVLAALLMSGMRHRYALVTYSFAGLAFASMTQLFITGALARRRAKSGGFFTAAAHMIGDDRRRFGGYVVQAGMVVFLCAVAGGVFQRERRAVLTTGDSVKVTDPYGHEWTFASQGISAFDEPDRSVVAISLAVRRDGKSMGLLTSELRQQIDERGEPTFEPTTKVGVLSSPSEDVYLVLTNRIDKDVAALQIRFNPLTWWVWLSGGLMAFGGLFMMWPKVHQRAGVVLRNEDSVQAPVRVTVSDDDVEAAIRRAREKQISCVDCGPRPEPDAIYCSNCGVRLPAA